MTNKPACKTFAYWVVVDVGRCMRHSTGSVVVCVSQYMTAEDCPPTHFDCQYPVLQVSFTSFRKVHSNSPVYTAQLSRSTSISTSSTLYIPVQSSKERALGASHVACHTNVMCNASLCKFDVVTANPPLVLAANIMRQLRLLPDIQDTMM